MYAIGLLLSDFMRFNQNPRGKFKIYYCPKIVPYLLVSPLVRGNISYYPSLKTFISILTFYTYLACLFLLNTSYTYFSLSSWGTTSLSKRDTTIDQVFVTLDSKNRSPCTCLSLNTVKSWLPQLTSNLIHTDISFPRGTCYWAASFNLQRQQW